MQFQSRVHETAVLKGRWGQGSCVAGTTITEIVV